MSTAPGIAELFGSVFADIFPEPKPSRRGRGKSTASMALIGAAYEIARDTQPITVRGIAYKLFTRGFIASMSKNETQKVSRLLTDAREQGIIPWEWIVDETRTTERVNTWSSTDAIIHAAVNGYRRNYWQDQPNWVEVMSEKGTVRGVLRPVLEHFGVPFRVMHGFGSATAVNDLAAETQRADKPLTVIYVGDWDPSGLYMSEVDLPGRIARYGGHCQIIRVALSRQDVGEGTALPAFDVATKANDPRHKWFVDRYGIRCWELDALDANALRERVQNHIAQLIDAPAWNRAIEVETEEVASMQAFHTSWKASISKQDAKYSEVRP